MKSVILGPLCVATAVFSIACTQSAAPTSLPSPSSAASPAAPAAATPNEFAAAQAIYKKHCEACHGENAEGGIVKVDNKRLKVPSLKSGHVLTHPDEALVKKINKGGDGMPAFKDKLKPEEIQELLQLIRKEFQAGAASTATPAK